MALVATPPQTIERQNTSLLQRVHIPLLCVTSLLDKMRRLLVKELETFGGQLELTTRFKVFGRPDYEVNLVFI
jgi:hypothetical protein